MGESDNREHRSGMLGSAQSQDRFSELRSLRSVTQSKLPPPPAFNTALSHFRGEVLRLGDFTEQYVISDYAADVGLPTFHLVPQD